MKKLLFSLILLLVSYVGFSQKGLSYQAVILDHTAIEVPGQDITGQPLVNGDVWIKFSIYNGSTLQFEEVQKTRTDAYGLVNLMIGSVSTASFNSLTWDGVQKSLQVFVSFNQGASYTKVSDQKLNYNPYALYAETAGKLGGVLGIASGGTGATTAAGARASLGLGNVENTSDAEKPISSATKAALDLKVNSSDVTTALALKANSADVNSALAAKVDSAFVLAKVAAATIADADTSTKGKIQLAGDLGGTAAAPTVPGLALKANTADVTVSLALKANSADVNSALAAKVDSAFVLTKVAAATIADADTSTKGKIQLAGDLAGTAAAPTVPGLALKANAADVTAALALKANSSDVNSALAAKVDSAFVLAKVVATSIADAEATTKGKIQLAGDLAGTAAAPTVPGLALKANTTDVNTALALKAPLASPALSGIPTAPTASAGTSTTQIATTEYTNAAISSALSSTLFSISTTLTSTVTNPLGFEPTLDSINYSGPLNVSTAQNLANGVDVLKVNQSGIANVGFGLANLFSNTTGNANTSVGYKGLYSNTSGRGNSSFGYYSLFNNTTGNANTANGGQSLFYNTTGGANTASGKFALFSNISANFNTATGYQALYANTTGGNNTATGATSLRSNTTGSSNTASGFGALFKNTTGSQNTANGEVALYSNTTGYSNTASGSFALYKNTTGANNMASGFYALFNNTQGSDNTASGKSALYSNTTGIENTAIGKNALITNTTGSNNTAIGSNADVAFNNLSNATAIGYSASVSTSNTIQLGNADVRNVKTSGTITSGAVTYPNTAGTNGQVLTSNGAGDASWISPTSVSVGTISSTSNANGATITSGVLNLTPADETNGGIVTTGTQTFAGLKTFKDGINYIKVSSSSTLDQSNISSNQSAGGTSVWQSFTAGINGILSSVEWEMQGGTSPDRRIAVNIYNGEGTSGTLLGTANGMIPFVVGISFVAFDLSSSNIKVMAGQIYTIQATTVLNASSRYNNSNVYTGGRSSVTPFVDFGFKTYVKATSTDSYLPLSGGALTGDLSTSGTLTAGTVTYPNTHGTEGQVLTSTGSGTLAWTTPSSVSGGTHTLGELYGGGIVFYVTADGLHGLIAETVDQSPGSMWFEAQDIISTSTTHSPEGALFTDWRLPTKNELNLMYTNIGPLTQYAIISGFSLGGSVPVKYWSSTKDYGPPMDYAYYFVKNFSDGRQGFDSEIDLAYVRAIRAF
jgi:ubiquinone biosynthesis protein UbiJ